MVGDRRLPQLVEHAGVRDGERGPDSGHPDEERSCRAPRSAADEQDDERRDHGQGEQLDGDRGAGEHTGSPPAPGAALRVERHGDGREREHDGRRVGLHPGRLHRVRGHDGEQAGGADRSPDAGDLSPDGVGGDQSDERHEHEGDPDALDAVPRQE
jgi:hypothetical protein